MVPSHRRLPLDGGGRFAVGRLAPGHHLRLGAGLDRDGAGRVLGFGCGGGDKEETDVLEAAEPNWEEKVQGKCWEM